MKGWQGTRFGTIAATAVLLGVAGLAIVRVAGDDSTPTEIAVPSTTSPLPSTTAPTPFHYRIGLLSGVTTDNYWSYLGQSQTAWNAYVLGATKPSLYGIDPATQQLIPDLARQSRPPEPEQTTDGWRVDVELRTGATWSDGKPVTAEDVVYTFETARRLGLGGGWAEAFPAEIAGLTAISDSKLRVEFADRPSLAVWPHALGLAPVMPAHVWQPVTDGIGGGQSLYQADGARDVSGGPVVLLHADGQTIEAVPHPGRTDLGFDSVSYTTFEDELQAVTALADGEIDTFLDPNGLSSAAASRLDGLQTVELSSSPANAVRYLGFNLTRAPMSDQAFRRALALLLDKEAAAQGLLPGSDPAYTVVSPSNRAWFDDSAAESIEQVYGAPMDTRLDQALETLTGAGYTWETPPSIAGDEASPGKGLAIGGQKPAPLTILTPGDEYDPVRPDYTLRIEEALEIIGFDVRTVVTDFETVVDLAFTTDGAGVRQYDMYVLGWTLGNPARPDYYGSLFASGGGANSTGYSDPDFESHLTRYEAAADADAARAALWDMEATLAEDLPYLVLYHPALVEAYRSDRIRLPEPAVLGGIQGRLGALAELEPVS